MDRSCFTLRRRMGTDGMGRSRNVRLELSSAEQHRRNVRHNLYRLLTYCPCRAVRILARGQGIRLVGLGWLETSDQSKLSEARS